MIEIEYAPLEAFRRLRHLRHLVFFDSARFHPLHGRYSFIAADPQITVRSQSNSTTISSSWGHRVVPGDPWEILDHLLSRFRLPFQSENPLWPHGAAIGCFSYDAAKWLDRTPPPYSEILPTPEIWFGFYDVLLAFDHATQRGWLISSGMDESSVQDRSKANFRRDQFLDELQSDVTLFPSPTGAADAISPLRSREDHEQAVRKALDYIRRGDIYQVNLSYPFLGRVSQIPSDLYLQLRQSNPAPFGGYMDLGDTQILSSSPERFLKMDRKEIQTRPIKGTCFRSGNPREDWSRAEALIRSAKNQAELLMITDLLRNDLGKVAEFGSVRVPELFCCEEYETVYHLVSTIEARLRPHALHLDTLAACFPGGSVTGAPKLRSMEIIRELEPWARGIYTGAIGYIGFNGISDFNIAIRTLVHQHGQVCFHVGSGIVADSDPALEFEETLHKAQGMLRLWPFPGAVSRVNLLA